MPIGSDSKCSGNALKATKSSIHMPRLSLCTPNRTETKETQVPQLFPNIKDRKHFQWRLPGDGTQTAVTLLNGLGLHHPTQPRQSPAQPRGCTQWPYCHVAE